MFQRWLSKGGGSGGGGGGGTPAVAPHHHRQQQNMAHSTRKPREVDEDAGRPNRGAGLVLPSGAEERAATLSGATTTTTTTIPAAVADGRGA